MGVIVDLEWKVQIQSFPNAPRGGDLGVFVPTDDGALAALIDATGHGLTAYSVAQKARNTILQSKLRAPDEVLYELHDTLSGSIGAAISVAHIQGDFIDFAGIGNVKASVNLKPLRVRTGIVGQRMRTPTVTRVGFPPNVWLLMHTDGVSTLRSIPSGSAETAARKLVETHGTIHDDSAVLLVRRVGGSS